MRLGMSLLWTALSDKCYNYLLRAFPFSFGHVGIPSRQLHILSPTSFTPLRRSFNSANNAVATFCPGIVLIGIGKEYYPITV